MAAVIRIATPEDGDGVAAIYAPIVAATVISFETEPLDGAEMGRRITDTLNRYPWLVCERDGAVLGYAYASLHRARAAYQWSADVTVYIHERARRAGIGRTLYTALFELLVAQGFFNAYAGITLPNAGSVGLHEAVGFTQVGVFQNVGYKLGAWHNVGWWQKSLQPSSAPSGPPRAFASLQRTDQVQPALARGLRLLHL